jgi:pimeloyl-ACP methyl ester carboxylesterase
MPFARIAALRIFYKDVGQGPPLLLIPGFGADSTAYNGLLPRLRGRLRLIAPDPRGLGRSDDAPGPLTSRHLVRDLVGVMDHLGISRTAILGSSMGAWVAIRMAAMHPERVERLVLCTPGAGNGPYARRVRGLLRALLEGAHPGDLMGHLLTLILSPRFLEENEALVREVERATRPDDRTRGTMARQLDMMAQEAGEKAGPIRTPALILAGSQDRLAPLHSVEALHRSLPGSRLVVLEGVAHHPFLEAPERAIAAVVSFLDGR